MNNHLHLLYRPLHAIAALKDLRQLLQRPILRFDKEKVNECKLKHIPKDEQEIVPPARPRERNARHERVVKRRDVDPEVVHAHALGAGLVAQHFDGVQRLQRRVASGNDEAEDEDERDLGLGLRAVFGRERAVRRVGKVGGVERGDEDEDADNDARRDEKLRATTPLVGEDGARDGAEERDNVLKAL